MIFLLQIILAPITIAALIGLIIVANKRHALVHKILAAQAPASTEPAAESVLTSRWQEILRHIESVHEGEWKFAVIEADKLVDDALKNLFGGENMGERLMGLDKTKLLTIDGLWEAHKVRNRLAHDLNYFLRHAEAVRAIRLFEATLKELEVI